MYDATENLPSADEIVAAVTALSEQRDELLDRLDSAEVALLIQQRECERIRWELEDMKAESLVIRRMALPSGQPWAFIPDAMLLAISPEVDAATEARLVAQAVPPAMTTCETCGAPLYAGATCEMHGD